MIVGSRSRSILSVLSLVALASLATVAAPAPAHAGGLYLPGIGPTAQSRAGAYVAKSDDPTAIGTNPAGLADADSGTVIFVGANLVNYSLEYTRRGTYDAVPNEDIPWAGQAYATVNNDDARPAIGIGPYQAVPMIAVSSGLGLGIDGLRFGFGLIAPTAYPERDIGSDYVLDDPDVPPPPGRYDTVTQSAAVVLPSIGAGYRVNDKLDVGVRLSWGLGQVQGKTYVWGTSNNPEWTGNDAVFTIDAKDNFVPAFGVGVLARPIDHVEVGLNFDSQVNVHGKGTGTSVASDSLAIGGMPVVVLPPDDSMAKCAPGGTADALSACIDIGLPMVTTLGGRYIFDDGAGGERGDVELDVAWERWSAVSDHHVVVDGAALGTIPLNATDIQHGAKDVISVRLGGGWSVPMGGNALALSGGVAMDTAMAKDGWQRLDLDGAARQTVAAGVSYVLPKLTFHLGGGYVHEGTRDVGTDCNPQPGMGCAADGSELPPDQRTGPDPVQPLNAGTPFESPMNAGTYTSSYLLFNLSVTAKF